MKRECFTPPKHSRVCAELLTKVSFQQNLTVRSLQRLSFKPRRLALKKDAFIDDSQLPYGKFQTRIWANKRRKTSG